MNETTSNRAITLALTQAANSLKASRRSPNAETKNEALEQFFSILDVAAKQGFSMNGYNVAPNSTVDARMLQQLIPALFNAKPVAKSPVTHALHG